LKCFRPTRQLLAEIQRVFDENKPSFHDSPIDDVIELLIGGRHYSWIGLYLALGDGGQQAMAVAGDHPEQVALPQTRSKILVSLKLAGRELGVLSVESDRRNALRADDRALLEAVADAMARFLSGPGKYLVRKARQKATRPVPKSQAAPVSPSTAARPTRSAAVGEK
jgi:hypothetical protein